MKQQSRNSRFAHPGWKLMAAAALMSGALAANAAQTCYPVTGHYTESAEFPPTCGSPVFLCLKGNVSGTLRGSFATTVNVLVPSADTPTTGVVAFNSDTVATGFIGNRSGTLQIKNAGSIRGAGAGEIVDLQVIVGGTGDFAGASGAIMSNGHFDQATGSGTSEYSGTVCVQ
ncbi:MAG: hypothetical protein KF778_15620 [Rhodocyclaceae bacterium]|nr:hypothetical protein [Rhodocyclaceae bacterium]MBX3669830.1 hypothetical protein [Rhodocyclaceae bacterium]